MEDCKTLELSIEKTKIYAENYNYLETTTQALDHSDTPQSCGTISVFNLHKKLIFNCEFCDFKYGDLDNFGRHLHKAHNQTQEAVKENACNESKSSRISNVVKMEPLEPAIDLPPWYFTELLVTCGNLFVLKGLRFLMACGYCDGMKYYNMEMFQKHIKSQHNILEGGHNELNVVPKVEETIEEEFITITELEKAKIKEENEAKVKEKNSKKSEESVEEDEEIESGEEFQDIESDEDEEFMNEEESSTSCSAAKSKRPWSADGPSTTTVNKEDTSQKKEKAEKKLLPTEEKLYACEHCEKKFKSKYQLQHHMPLHTAYLYECEICNKRFCNLRSCKEHYTKHLERRTYDCDLCEKTFLRADGLKLHKIVHTGEKSFKCDICNKCYFSNAALSAHKKLHSGVDLKTLKCDYCDKFFRFNRDRIDHMRVHTGEKPFKCDVCQRCYTAKNGLLQHFKKHHNAAVEL